MAADLEIYDAATITIPFDDLISLGDITPDGIVSLPSAKIKNIGTSTATNIRIAARCLNGLYTGQANSEGQEIITNQWIEANSGSGWTPIGGDFSITDPASNYISLSDLSAGAISGQIDFRINFPASGVTTAGQVIFQGILVSWEP